MEVKEILKVLYNYIETVKMGSDGDYETYNAILEENFINLADELVKKLSLDVVSNNEDAEKKKLQKQHIINIMQEDEKLKLYSEVAVCPQCNGTGIDGHDGCYPPNWYVCEICNGSG